MLTRRRVPIGTTDDSCLNGFNVSPDVNLVNSHTRDSSEGRVRPASARSDGRMSVQDRSVEFLSFIKSTQARNPRYNSSNFKQKSTADEFQVISSKIAKDIAHTSEKLLSLDLIVAKKNDAEGHEAANQLTDVIRQDLNVFNKQIAQLQQFLKHQVFNKQKMAHASSVIMALQSKLVRMSTDFKVILELKQQNVKNAIKMNESQNIPVSSKGFQADDWIYPNYSNNPYNHQANTIPRSQRKPQHNYPSPPLSSSSSQAPPSLSLPPHSSSSMHQIPIQSSYNNHYMPQNDPAFYQREEYPHGTNYQPSQALRQRYVQEEKPKDEMVEIEQTIVELGGIFQQLNNMVHEQGEMVERIDSHIDVANLNIDQAHTELVKYFRSVASQRGLILKFFAVLLIFIIFFFFFYL